VNSEVGSVTDPNYFFPDVDPVPPRPPLRAAPFWRRLVARLIDFAIALPLAFVLVLPIVVVLAPVWIALGRSGIDDWEDRVWGPIGASVCLFLSFIALELFLLVNRQGQTLGKGLVRIRVVRVDERPLTVTASFVRLVVLFAVNWIWHPVNMLLVLANVVAVTVDRRYRRAAHDYAARTRVVMADRRSIKFADMKLMAPRFRPPGGQR
jgi:uncharacterized RDD family membrane protein YckC